MSTTRISQAYEQLESMIAIVLQRVPSLRAELEELRGQLPPAAGLYCSSTLDNVQWTAKVLKEMLRRDAPKRRRPR